jgi:hypothetical protein
VLLALRSRADDRQDHFLTQLIKVIVIVGAGGRRSASLD